jgi:Zn-finger nucleic acid-binding protein
MQLFREKDYYFCEYCGTFYFPEPNLDGVRSLHEVAEGLSCPVCRGPLVYAALDWVRGYHCEKCKGVLMNRILLGDLIDYRRARAKGPSAPPIPLNQAELKRNVICPRCGQKMETHPYYGPGNIVIDTCGSCNLIWLDFGELRQVVDAPGRDRGEEYNKKPIED